MTADEFYLAWYRLNSVGFRGPVMVLGGYFDETELQHGPRTTAVGGFLFELEDVARFDREWGPEIIGLKIPFHTASIGGSVGRHDFADWPAWRRTALLNKLAHISAETRGHGFLCAVDQAEYDAHVQDNPQSRKIMGEPYTLCLMACVNLVRVYLERTRPDDTVAYWIENGAPHWKQAERFFANLSAHASGRDFYRIESRSFVPKFRAPTLCAADFLVWEWQRNYAEAESNVANGMDAGPYRESFRMLFNGPESPPIHVETLGRGRMDVQSIVNRFYKLYD